MQRIAVPMIGGMVSSTVLTLVVIPAIFAVIKGYGLPASPWQDGDEKDGGHRNLTTTLDLHRAESVQ
jgi:Cu(I)/Ag(I) efflux system membrane protein CusA/SilA